MRVLFVLALMALPASAPPIRCGDGRVDAVIDTFDFITAWSAPFRDRELPQVALTSVPGCTNGALGVRWNLNGGEWFVLAISPSRSTSRRSRICG